MRIIIQKKGYWLLIVILACFLLVDLVSFSNHGRFWRALQNAGHAPVFGLFALTIFQFLNHGHIPASASLWRRYCYAGLLAVAIGALLEFKQIFSDRDASWLDLLIDAVGAISFLSAHAFLTRSKQAPKARQAIIVCFVLSVLALGAVFTPVFILSGGMMQRWLIFPDINRFSSVWERVYIKPMNASLVWNTQPPIKGSAFSTGWLAIRFDQNGYQGVWLDEPYPDWRGFETLRFELYSEFSETFRLTIRVHDFAHNYRFGDRYNGSVQINPGQNSVRIPLSRIKSGPRNRQLQMESIAQIGIFTTDARLKGRALWLNHISLE